MSAACTNESFTFDGFLPNDVEKLQKLLNGARDVRFSLKFATMQDICNVLDATRGSLLSLKVPKLSLLDARDKMPEFTAAPSPETCAGLTHLEINCSFQPNTPKQVQAFVDAISHAVGLQGLVCNISEYPTDAFLNRDEEYLRLDFPTLELPSMLRMPTRAQRLAMEIEEDGRVWGSAFPSAITGQQLIAPSVNPVDAVIDSVLDAHLTNIGGSNTTAAALTLGQRQSEQQPMTREEVRRSSALTMRMLDQTPKNQFMTPYQWRSGIMLFLASPLPRGLTSLTLRTLFPRNPDRTMRVLSGLAWLKTLILQFCDITDATLARLMPDLVHMPKLQTLDLTRNSLTDRADLRPLGEQITSLETLVLQFNQTGGMAFTSLFDGIVESSNITLTKIDFSENPFQPEGLSFFGLTKWKAPNATLVLPNIFDVETVGRIESLMPDGSTLILEGVNRDFGSNWTQAAAVARLEL